MDTSLTNELTKPRQNKQILINSNLRAFKDIQILYEFCLLETEKLRKLLKKSLSAFLMAGIDGMHVIPLKCVKGAAV